MTQVQLTQDPETGYWNRIKGRPDLVLRTHPRKDDCYLNGCDVHNRLFNVDMPLLWRTDRGIMEFVCEHGTGHPTKHQIDYWERTCPEDVVWLTVHGCCGCCSNA